MCGTGTRLTCARAKARERCWPSTIQAARCPSGRSGIVSVPDLPTSIRHLGFGRRDPSNATSGERARMIAQGNNVGSQARKRSEEVTSELQSLMRKSHSVFCVIKDSTTTFSPKIRDLIIVTLQLHTGIEEWIVT